LTEFQNQISNFRKTSPVEAELWYTDRWKTWWC